MPLGLIERPSPRLVVQSSSFFRAALSVLVSGELGEGLIELVRDALVFLFLLNQFVWKSEKHFEIRRTVYQTDCDDFHHNMNGKRQKYISEDEVSHQIGSNQIMPIKTKTRTLEYDFNERCLHLLQTCAIGNF